MNRRQYELELSRLNKNHSKELAKIAQRMMETALEYNRRDLAIRMECQAKRDEVERKIEMLRKERIGCEKESQKYFAMTEEIHNKENLLHRLKEQRDMEILKVRNERTEEIYQMNFETRQMQAELEKCKTDLKARYAEEQGTGSGEQESGLPADPLNPPAVWLDGSLWTAQVALRRIINKLPDTKGRNVSFDFGLNCQGGKWWAVLTEAHDQKVHQVMLAEGVDQADQTDRWLREIREDFE